MVRSSPALTAAMTRQLPRSVGGSNALTTLDRTLAGGALFRPSAASDEF